MPLFVCRHGGAPDIDAEERVPRCTAIAINGLDAQGDPDWRHEPSQRDDAEWEGNALIGFRCTSCEEASEILADLVHAVAD
ncbi:MAG: hypothetical protein ACLQBX_06515 [Candidatus Limnocylindrales bacterium]